MTLMLVLGACAARGPDWNGVAVDPMTTSAVPVQASAQSDIYELSDSKVIREALAALPEGQSISEAIGWSNARTGSLGDIQSVEERNDEGVLCRTFTTSRETFEGVSLYYGESCRSPSGAWWMRRFEPA